MSQKRRIPKSCSTPLLDDFFDNSNINSHYTLVNIVKRVKTDRPIENITGTRGMSIHSIPEDIYIPESVIEYLEDYYRNN